MTSKRATGAVTAHIAPTVAISKIEELRYLLCAQAAMQNQQYDELDGAWAKEGKLRPGVL